MEKFGVIKKKSLLFIMVAGLGVWNRVMEAGSPSRPPTPHPDVVDGQRSFLVWGYEGSRIILHCSTAFKGPLVRGLGNWGALFSPFHLLRSWLGGPWNPLQNYVEVYCGSLDLARKGD